MALFGFGKKEEKGKNVCCCGSITASDELAAPACACNGNPAEFVASEGCCGGDECGIQSIKVLGPGCKSCHELNEACHAAIKKLGMNLKVEYITDMETIVNYGAMSMPALVINEKVVSMGKALKTAEVINLLKKQGYC